MNKNVKVGINENEYKEYCEKLGLDPEHKMSKLRYASTKDEDAKKLLEKIESGEVDLDKVNFLEVDPKEIKKDLTKGLKMLFEGIAYLTANKEKLENHPFYELEENDKLKIILALMESWGNDLTAINNSITDASIMFNFKNYMKGREKNDKKA